jgi:hypothetical protein
MRKLVVKSGVDQLDLFKGHSFPYFEAYLRGDENKEDLVKLVSQEMKLLCLHLPARIKLETGDWLSVNFCSEDKQVTDNSFKVLQHYLAFADQNDISYIVLHLGTYNGLLGKEKKFELLNRVAENFNHLDFKNVKVCVENVPFWTDLSFQNESIIADEKDFNYLKGECSKIGSAFDVDHLALHAVFSKFYYQFKQESANYKGKDFIHFKKKMEQTILEATKQDPEKYQQIIEKAIINFLSAVKPSYVHAVGTDFCNYFLSEKMPLVGEALPLGYNGTIKGYNVKDHLNHAQWISLLPKDVPITLEIMMRPDYDYLTEIKKSWELVEGL